jgi:hypothetical protein
MSQNPRLEELGLDLETAQALRDLALQGSVEAAVAERACPELERRGLVRLGAGGYEPTQTGIVVARQVDAALRPPSA